MPELKVGGLTPLTSIDYPGELAAVVFCHGCPWRCRYCHNGHLLGGLRDAPRLAWYKVLDFLNRRRGLLDAVVFSGGEPTGQSGLLRAIDQVRARGFKVGLHTAGCYPKRLARVLPHVDWVGLDIKAAPGAYVSVTRVPGSGALAWESLRLVLDSAVDHEIRVTVHSGLLCDQELHRLVSELRAAGAQNIVLQRCRTGGMLDPALGDNHHLWPSDAGRFAA
jgi:pyruvate formate lyase activating enzyme